MPEFPQVLDTKKRSEEANNLYERLVETVIGQERAARQFTKVYQQAMVGLNRENRPLAVFLFLGPTGVGKTSLVLTAAEALLGKKNAVTRIDCGEYAHSHETAKLLGAPPGYLGHKETTPRLSQAEIDKYQTEKHKINFVLFDEIEEAHEILFATILQILDAGRVTLGNNETVDFTKSIIIMTSNLGEKETQSVLLGKGIGLAPPTNSERVVMDEEVYKASKSAATRHFKAKFINRLDRIIVFRSLSQESLLRILHNELTDLEFRLWKAPSKNWNPKDGDFPTFVVKFRTTEAADKFLLKEGTSPIYGARELNRAIDRFVAFPLGSLMGSKQIEHGDVLEIDYEDGAKELIFRKVEHRDLKPLKALNPSTAPNFESPASFCKHNMPVKDCEICNPSPPKPSWLRRPAKWRES